MKILFADEIVDKWRKHGGLAFDEARAEVQVAAHDGHPTYLARAMEIVSEHICSTEF